VKPDGAIEGEAFGAYGVDINEHGTSKGNADYTKGPPTVKNCMVVQSVLMTVRMCAIVRAIGPPVAWGPFKGMQ
jgi:hypothetical protein